MGKDTARVTSPLDRLLAGRGDERKANFPFGKQPEIIRDKRTQSA